MGDTNNHEQNIKRIREALGNPDGYNISLPDDCFQISPQNKTNQPSIRLLDFSILGEYNLYFRDCIFNIDTIFMGTSKTIRFDDCSFKGKIQCISDIKEVATFYHTIFENDVFFRYNFEKGANFSKSIFRGRAVFSAEFKGEANFRSVIFHDVRFNDARFQKVDFSDAKFLHNAEFQSSHFNEQAFFSHATFQQVSFRGSIFDANVYFFEANFHTIPEFLQVSFNKNINFTNTELDFDFEEAKEKIKEIYKTRKAEYEMENKEDKEYKEEPKEYRIANEFRDSFRTIKSALIKDNNMLDASNYRRDELYCKELELGYKKEKSTRDIVDRIHLMAYRLTSDHHTDLLLILNNVIILIACFGAINFAFNLLSNNYFKVNSLTIGHAIGALIACSIFAILAICLIMGCCKKLLDYFNSNIDNIRLFLSKALPHKEQDTTCPRACVVFFSYITTAIILVVKPALLVPIFGQMIDSKSSIGFAFASLNIIYAILMFLLIFSLQKTARKNTIVPN